MRTKMDKFKIGFMLFLHVFAVMISAQNGFIDFEEGQDKAVIRSIIPGLKFSTTYGYDWVYGDWRTNNYNGPYPDGSYTSNGNIFAWLGPNSGTGRIDFIHGTATYISVLTSTYSGLVIDAYDKNDKLIASSDWASSNLNTGNMTRLTVSAPDISYVLIHDSGNYWLIDDLITDAPGVPGEPAISGMVSLQQWDEQNNTLEARLNIFNIGQLDALNAVLKNVITPAGISLSSKNNPLPINLGSITARDGVEIPLIFSVPSDYSADSFEFSVAIEYTDNLSRNYSISFIRSVILERTEQQRQFK